MSLNTCSAANGAAPCERLKSAASPEVIDAAQIAKVPHQRPGLFYRPRPLLLIPNEQHEPHQVNCLIGKSLSLWLDGAEAVPEKVGERSSDPK